jgi:hypothetical protein
MIDFTSQQRVTTRERGVIPGCRPPGRDSHMAVDSRGRPWVEVARQPSTIDAWLAELRQSVTNSRKGRNACTRCGEMKCEHREHRKQ